MTDKAPLYGQIHAVAATIRTRTSSGWLHDAARHLDHLAIEVGKTIHDTAAELADAQRLAANRLEHLDSVRDECIENREELDHVAQALIKAFNPPDADVAESSIYEDAVERAAAYIAKQPCTCDATEVRIEGPAKACERCSVLGRALDQQVER